MLTRGGGFTKEHSCAGGTLMVLANEGAVALRILRHKSQSQEFLSIKRKLQLARYYADGCTGDPAGRPYALLRDAVSF
jgi:hypothetical protein